MNASQLVCVAVFIELFGERVAVNPRSLGFYDPMGELKYLAQDFVSTLLQCPSQFQLHRKGVSCKNIRHGQKHGWKDSKNIHNFSEII